MMSSKNIKQFPEWLEWLKSNYERGCNPAELTEILLKNGFSQDSIAEAIKNPTTAKRKPAAKKQTSKKRGPSVDFMRLSKPRLLEPNNGFSVREHPNSKLQIFFVDDFLSAQQCQQLVDLSAKILRPSTITQSFLSTANDPYAAQSTDSDFRTSHTADFDRLSDPIVDEVDQRICQCLGIDAPFAEITQVQRYDVGQQFKLHTDYFEPHSEEYEKFASAQGNRTWTFMVYLSDVPKGGGTHFSAIDSIIMPKKGMAVVWNNRYPNGDVNPDSIHAGLPVEEGQKFVITKWFRERSLK